MSLELVKHKKPRPLPQLDGDLGLTGKDISYCLGIPFGKLSSKFKYGTTQEMFKSMNIMPVEFKERNPHTGTTHTDWAFSVRAAQVMVAKYNNPTGWAYLTFLLDLQGDNQKLQKKVFALLEEITLLKNKQIKSKSNTIKVYTTHTRKTIFGEEDIYYTSEKIPRSEATESQKRSDKFKRLVSIAEGVAKAMKKIFSEEEEKKQKLLLTK